MTTKENITNRDLFDAINSLRKEIKSEYDHRLERMEACVDANTDWRNQITGKLTILMIIIGAAVNWFWDRVFN